MELCAKPEQNIQFGNKTNEHDNCYNFKLKIENEFKFSGNFK